MACLMNVLLASVVICSIVKDAAAQGAQVQGVDNAEQFALLCRIYNVAKNPPINHVDLQDPVMIVDEIDAIKASFVEEKPLNKTENVGSSSDGQVTLTTTGEPAVAQALINRITQKAHIILEKIKKTNVTEEIEKVKAEFAQVIFGEGGSEGDLCHGALSGVAQRGAACGTPGTGMKGNSAGNSLVVDFFCLCAMRADDGMENACGVRIGGKSSKPDNHGWGSTDGPLGSPSMWASIKKECGTLLHHHPKSTGEGEEILEEFLRHIKLGGVYRWGTTSNVQGSGKKEGMLGTGVGNNDGDHEGGLLCDGTRGKKGVRAVRGNGENTVNPGGVCVYYGPKSEWQNIPWLKKFQTALEIVDVANNQTAIIQRAIEKLQTLLRRAEEIYETTR
ncbi:Variant surface glycoprotein, partial [Trypanosoma congolense IL3000]